MTIGHIACIYFDGKREYAKKRLQKLKAAGLVSERKRPQNEPSLLMLSTTGFELLRGEGQLSGYPALSVRAFEARRDVSDFTLRHELEVMDVKAAFYGALAESPRFSIAEFSTWPRLFEFETSGTGGSQLTKPDALIRIVETKPGGACSIHRFFLELDRSQEPQETLVTKARSYMEYYRSGAFAERQGASRSSFKEYPFRVLMVFKTPERRNNTALRLLQLTPPILTHACLATLGEVKNSVMEAIWICPLHYHEATKETTFAPDAKQEVQYRRNADREAFIEERIQRIHILGEPSTV